MKILWSHCKHTIKFSIGVLLMTNALAIGQVQENIVKKSQSTDLDGNGDIDNIRAAFYYMGDGYSFNRVVLEVNGTFFVAKGSSIEPTLYIVDIDTIDSFKEIAIFDRGPSEDPETHFFRFANGIIVDIDIVPGKTIGPPQVSGTGKVHTSCRGTVLETWWYPCKFKLNRFSSRLEESVQHWKPMTAKVTLKTDLPLLTSPSLFPSPQSNRPADTLRAGDRASILKTDDTNWCYIESENGSSGWFGLIGCCRIASNGLMAIEVFDGLRIAD